MFYGANCGVSVVLKEPHPKDLLRTEKDSMNYEYDFGDGWSHKITLEKILPFEVSSRLVKCITGRRACPPEDCGGIWGYASLLEAVDDPNHPEHEEIVEWLDEGFDPAHFSLSDVNMRLQRYY